MTEQANMKTLISFIGKGLRAKQSESNDTTDVETYQRTVYVYDDKEYETAVFTEALVKEFKKGNLKECVLIGTCGSAWGSLIERSAYEEEKNIALFDRLEKAFQQERVFRPLLKELENVLKAEWKIPVRCVVHKSEIKENDVPVVLRQYADAMRSRIGTGIIVDITHAFRSMPVILMGAVQMVESAEIDPMEIEIVYGEFSETGNSIVRTLEPMWNGIHFARALRRFKERFDGEELASLIKKEWPAGAKAINNFGEMVQANFVTHLEVRLEQVKNAQDKYSAIDAPEIQTVLAAEALERMVAPLNRAQNRHRRIFALAELLKERHLWGQAITTLRLSFEAFVFHYYKNGGFGDYDVTEELCKEFEAEISNRNEDMKSYHNLRKTRNAIAHGGLRSKNGGLPQMQNLPKQFDSSSRWLKETFRKDTK